MIRRMSASASRSAAVTGLPSAFHSTGSPRLKYARVRRPPASAASTASSSRSRRAGSGNHPSEHVGEEPTVVVVRHVVGRVDARDRRERLRSTALVLGPDREPLLWGEILGQALDVVDLASGETERGGRLPCLELERHDAHTNQVRAVDALRSEEHTSELQSLTNLVC